MISSRWRAFGRRIVRHRPGLIAGSVLVLLGALAILAPVIGYLLETDAISVDLFARFEPPSAQHPLGTDELGRDVLLRLLYGAQISLSVGVIGALCAACLGTLLGLVAGYAGGRVDSLLMRLTDAVISLPTLPLLIVLAALDLHKIGISDPGSAQASLMRIVIIVALFGWTTVARLVRGATLSVREREYVRAAQALGAQPLRVMYLHILPNIISPLIIATTLAVGNIILLESVLSFLGLGIQPPLPSWGNLLTQAQTLIHQEPALAIYPGAMIFLTVLCVNFLGDALQEILDPRTTSGQK